MSLKREYQDYMRRWKASGRAVTDITCPHCKGTHEVPSIPDTDSAAVCPDCGELFMKVLDSNGQAHAMVPGVAA